MKCECRPNIIKEITFNEIPSPVWISRSAAEMKTSWIILIAWNMGAGCIQVVLQIMVQFQKIYLLHAHGSLVYTLHVLQANLMMIGQMREWDVQLLYLVVEKWLQKGDSTASCSVPTPDPEVLTISFFSQQLPWSSPLGVANGVIAVDHSLALLVQTGKDVRDVVGEEPNLFSGWLLCFLNKMSPLSWNYFDLHSLQ